LLKTTCIRPFVSPSLTGSRHIHLMEQPSKRQRTSRILGRSSTDSSWSESGSMSSTGVGTADVDEDHGNPEESSSGGGYASASLELRTPGNPKEKQGGSLGRGLALWARHRRLHQRQNVSDQGPASIGAVKTVIESVVQFVVENGQSSIAALTLPTVPTVVSFPSYGQLTVPAVPTYPSFPPQTLPTVPAYPFTSAAAATLGATTAMPSPSNAATSAPAAGPERSSASQGSNSSGIAGSSSYAPLTSTLPTPLSLSSVQSSSSISSILSQMSQASSLPVFPLMTAGGNLSRISESSALNCCGSLPNICPF